MISAFPGGDKEVLELLLTPWTRVAVTALFIAMIGLGIITAFAIESLQTGVVWSARGTRTRVKEPAIFWSHMALYGSALALATFVLRTAIAHLGQ
jgi:hypothetical protein